MGYFAPREAQTTLPCPDCGKPLDVRRACREAFMYCPKCRKRFPLAEYIGKADRAMEAFLENCYLDRL